MDKLMRLQKKLSQTYVISMLWNDLLSEIRELLLENIQQEDRDELFKVIINDEFPDFLQLELIILTEAACENILQNLKEAFPGLEWEQVIRSHGKEDVEYIICLRIDDDAIAYLPLFISEEVVL